MRREDFKEIKEEYLESCKKIVENLGDCGEVKCWNCPFEIFNLTDRYIHCGEYIHPNNSVYCTDVNKLRLGKARIFLEKFGK